MMMSLKKKKRNLWKVFLHKEITRHMRKLSRLLYCLFSSRIQRPIVVVRSEAAGEEEEEHQGAQQEEVQQQPRGEGARV